MHSPSATHNQTPQMLAHAIHHTALIRDDWLDLQKHTSTLTVNNASVCANKNTSACATTFSKRWIADCIWSVFSTGHNSSEHLRTRRHVEIFAGTVNANHVLLLDQHVTRIVRSTSFACVEQSTMSILPPCNKIYANDERTNDKQALQSISSEGWKKNAMLAGSLALAAPGHSMGEL